MLFDLFNTLIEFLIVFEIHLLISNERVSITNSVTYILSSILTSAYFAIFDPQILFLNLAFFVIIQLLCLKTGDIISKLIYSVVSVLCVFYLELMFCSILPITLLQTNNGNFYVVSIIFVLISSILIFIRKHKINALISDLLLKYKIVVPVILLFSCLFGQFYLSRLSVVWTYLPGLITTFLFILFFVMLSLHIYHVRSTDKLTLEIFQNNMKNTEACLTAIRITNHDYKHQIQNLRDQINAADSLDNLKASANSYIDQLSKDRALSSALLAITHPILRSILYGCYSRCIEKNIDFRFTSSYLLPSFPLKDHQLVDVLQNLLTNALEYNEAEEFNQRFIEINLYQKDDQHQIVISTPCHSNNISVSQILSSGFSTKGEGHLGLGLTSVQNLLKQNNIQFYGENSDSKLSFVLSYSEEKHS